MMNENMVCPICGNNMKMYNIWWCPYCEKPEPETVNVFNLIKCIDYLVARKLSAGKTHDELMEIAGRCYELKNDSCFRFYLLREEDMDDYVGEYVLFNNIITSSFDVSDGCLFEVSW